MLVQAFCKEFVVPHMQHFQEHCKIKSVHAPTSHCEFYLHLHGTLTNTALVLAEAISLEGWHHLSVFSSPITCHLQCTGLSAIVKPDIPNDTWHLSSSAAIRESAALVTSNAKIVHPALKPASSTPVSKKAQAETNSPSTLHQWSACQ